MRVSLTFAGLLLALCSFVTAHHGSNAEHSVTNASVTQALSSSTSATSTRTTQSTTTTTTMASPPKELLIETVHLPTNAASLPKSKKGDQISVHYTGTLFDGGTKFDSSIDRNKPFDLTLGAGQVIRGWDEGLQGMVVGEKRKLTIPPELAYGSKAFPPHIKPHSTLVFDVEMKAIKSKHAEL